MGKLDVNRMSNSTKLARVDNAHVALEQDLEEILGVPDNTIITVPIFGKTDDGELPVQPDGSLRGVMRFYESGVIASAATASGFEFTDGTVTKRVIMVNSTLEIYELDGTTWSKIGSLESAAEGTLVGLSDMEDGMTLAAGKVLSVHSGGTYFELVDPASGSGITRFADLNDTPAAVDAGQSFAASDVGKLVYVASTASLGFQPAGDGLGLPFVMSLATTADDGVWRNTPSSESGWPVVEQWDYVSYVDDGGYLTDDSDLFSPSDDDVNVFIELEEGLYQISFWFTCDNPNKWGTRQWRIAGDSSDGPATIGIQQEANLYWNTDGAYVDQPSALGGLHFLGSQMLIQYADDDIKFEVLQDSGTNFTGVYFYAVITKVK